MPQPLKPPALRPGDAIRILSLASPVDGTLLEKGCGELKRLGYVLKLDPPSVLARGGFFAGPAALRVSALKEALAENGSRAIFCSRGGYGANYLLDGLSVALASPKILLGHSDITSLQICLWQKFGWITLHGPMVASSIAHGAGAPKGYDRDSLLRSLTETKNGWRLDLKGQPLIGGSVEGILLGGCLTLVETTLGTPWELDTHGAILVLEDRGMKPYQVDRALMHLKQAGKFRSVAGIILGDFPECEAPADTESVKDVAHRILAPLGVPVVWGAPVGHTERPMITLPLGVRAHLTVQGAAGAAVNRTQLEVLEPACTA
ncbi:MAG: LD-carboxypeptidase [Candidatus Acidiferrales bacterium]|jgi:muramoyltetrapeptide carboxypeptidase